ncbi:metallophosphoesterase family protein [Cohnella boryungensis]|uniref:metallophosphoesterase family protein n=1 Tax=Cohnella boryungensis TaxID=768479 RepID=UPI00366B0939
MGVPFTFIHAADLHLDSPFKGLAKAPAAVRDRLRESTFAALDGLCSLAEREKADFVVLSGDLFDAADRSLRAQLRLQRALGEMTKRGTQVFITHGNHDPESGRQAKLDWPPGVFVFGSSQVDCYAALSRDGGEIIANVYGISYPTRVVSDNLALRFKKREGAPFHIAVLHANVDSNPAHDNYAPCRLDELASSGFDYWALGHVHDRRVLREYPHVVYPGNLQGRSVRETGSKGAYVVEVSGTGVVQLRFQDIADVLWQELPVSIEGMRREQELQDRMLAVLEEARSASGGRATLARIRLVGQGPLHASLLQNGRADEWLEGLRESVHSPEETEDWIWPESLSVRTGSRMQAFEEEGFLGDLARRGSEAANCPDTAKALLEEATEELRRQPKIREWLDGRTDEEREQWIRQALELAVSLLREEEAD